jgi:hypothetical protein
MTFLLRMPHDIVERPDRNETNPPGKFWPGAVIMSVDINISETMSSNGPHLERLFALDVRPAKMIGALESGL